MLLSSIGELRVRMALHIGEAEKRDNDYFVPASTKPAIYGAIKDRVTAMWNDSTAFVPFSPMVLSQRDRLDPEALSIIPNIVTRTGEKPTNLNMLRRSPRMPWL